MGSIQELEDQSRFLKKVGIVFLGKKWDWFLKQSRLHLDFDEVACAHIILQMNRIQNLFATNHPMKVITSPAMTAQSLEYAPDTPITTIPAIKRVLAAKDFLLTLNTFMTRLNRLGKIYKIYI